MRFGERKFSTRLNTIKHRVKGVNYGCYRKIRIDWADGHPIRHSLSPEMQNKALEKAGCHLPIWPLKWITIVFPEQLKIKSPQNARNWCVDAEQTTGGEYVDELTPAAKLVGAINTILMMMATCAAITPTARAIFAP